MFGIIGSVFTTFFYQPFFNLLVGVYTVLNFFIPGHADMGIAVIIFTIIFRILWLPMSLASDRSEKEQREISEEVKLINQKYATAPIKEREEIKKLLGRNKKIVIFSSINIAFQVLIALMLYRIFSTGLEGEDLHLLYPFMPSLKEPFNLIFLGKYNLALPNIPLNIVQTVLIFLVEFFGAVFSPFPATRQDITTVITLPIISYFFFMFMPAGKKLFIIVTLSFTLMLMIVKKAIFVYHSIMDRINKLPLGLAKTQEQAKNGV